MSIPPIKTRGFDIVGNKPIHADFLGVTLEIATGMPEMNFF